jgi:hypothetical protein
VPRIRPLLAATLIVRDEERTLLDCLASLGGLVDEIVVYDTGSQDRTVDLARDAGARVVLGRWEGDFSRARNAALAAADAEWVVIVDADERIVVDAHVLRRLLLGNIAHEPPVSQVEAFLLPVVSLTSEGKEQSVHYSTRLFRAVCGHWEGRVHEVVELSRPDAVRCLLPATIAFVEHHGYMEDATVRAKAERNLALTQAELDDLVTRNSDDRRAGARVLLDLARSLLVLGRRQQAVDALEALREIMDEGVHRAVATAMLAQVLLDAGGFNEVALVLEAELRADGHTDVRQADWIRAQALAGLGHLAEARDLLAGLDRMLDPAGTPLPMVPVQRLRARLEELAEPTG